MRLIGLLFASLLLLTACGGAAATVTPAPTVTPAVTPTATARPATPTVSVADYAATLRAAVLALTVVGRDIFRDCTSQTPTCQQDIATEQDVYTAQIAHLGQVSAPPACAILKTRADTFFLATNHLLDDLSFAYWHASSSNAFLALLAADAQPATAALDAFALERDTGACR